MPVTPDAAGPPVRRAEADDVPEILALSNHYAVHGTANFAHTPEPLEEWMAAWRETSETHPWLMIRDDAATLLGFARAAPWKSRTAYRSATEISVYIHPEHRGCGLGRRLYDVLFTLLDRQGYVTVLAGITLPNPASVRLHESCGMTQVAALDYIGWKFDAWYTVGYWQRRLRGLDEPPPPRRCVSDAWSDDQ